MRCSSAQRQLSAALDDAGDLTAATRRHVASCARCTAFADASARLRTMLRHEAEPSLVAARTASTATHSIPIGASRRSGRTLVSGLAIAALVAAVVGIATSRDDGATDIATTPAAFPVVDDGQEALLVWTSDGLPADLAQSVAQLAEVERVTEVRGDHVRFDVDEGWVDLDALAIDPVAYAPFVPQPDSARIASLQPNEALLGATSARLRDASIGDVLRIDGRSLTVAGIVDDRHLGAAEVVVAFDALPNVQTPRYLLVVHRGERAAVEDAIRLEVAADRGVRFRGATEAPILRHGDAVLPQSWVKRDFGEFVSPRSSATPRPDAQFVATKIATFDLEPFGSLTCHRDLEGPLRQAIARLDDQTRQPLAESSPTCYVPASSGRGLGVARSTWGITLTLTDAVGKAGGGADPALVTAFTAEGFVWGGDWLDPQPNRFEYVGR